MELAFATGYGPRLLTDFDVRAPLARPEDTVAFGFRDGDEQQQYGSQPLASEILALDLGMVRMMGLERAVAAALDRLSAPALDGFFIHLDADCLDDGIMPAVDYRLAGGFEWDELKSILTLAMASGRAVGLEVTIYNPALDADGAAGRGLTDALVGVLAATHGGGS
jgi:arginase